MTLLRDLIHIPESVGDADFVVRASGDADLGNYVVTDALRRNMDEALSTIGHAVTTGHSQATFLHGSFGSGKSHFMAVLREILRHNPDARAVRGLAAPVGKADSWLAGKNILTLSFHMLDAQSVEQAILEGYLRQVGARHPDAPVPAVHRSDSMLADAKNLRERMGDDAFFAALRGSDAAPGQGGGGLAAHTARAAGWTAVTYDAAAADIPGTPTRDALVSALTSTFYTSAVHSGEYLDLDTGLAIITRHAQDLGYDAMVLFLDELILWLSTRIADHTFVQTEGAKLNKLVESADAARPIPVVSFVARQRNLEDFLGPQVGGTERAALADLMRSVQGRLGNIVLADTNLPEITEKRLLKPVDDNARQVIDRSFRAVRGNREIWDILLLGAQYGDAGIGSDADAFRRLYPFSPALVATLVALSQALQRERTALRVMTELLVERRDTLTAGDLIGVAALFEPLVLRGDLPDEPKLKQQFQSARDIYRRRLRPLLLSTHGITAAQAAEHDGFLLDDKLIRTLLLGALVPEVPALTNLTAAKLHALNFGTIHAPIPGYENQLVLERMRRLNRDTGDLHVTDSPDPVISLKLSTVDFDKLLDLVPYGETTSGVLQQLIRELICVELGLASDHGTFGELVHPRDWRGRRHAVQVRFGNVRDRDTLPMSSLLATGESWRLIIDYPFDQGGYTRRDDIARIHDVIRDLDNSSRTVFWVPLHLTEEVMKRVGQLVRVNYLLGSSGGGERLHTLASDWSAAERQQGKVYLQQRQLQLRQTIVDALKQAYGVVKPQPSDVEEDREAVLHTLAEGLRLGDPRGGSLGAAFTLLTGDLLAWAYPGTPTLPDDEKPPTRGEMAKVLHYAHLAAADPTRGTVVDPADRRTVARICNPLRLGRLEEHRYVLETTTCWWSHHLTQLASQRDYRDHFPVHVLRELLDQPEPRGFDRDLQNLILAVFALEQQLAWYHHGTKVRLDTVQAVNDQMELRQPPMPEADAWTRAVRRGQAIFGQVLPQWRSPANLPELAGTLRRTASDHAPAVAALADTLAGHADVLGLDPSRGRLATAGRVATFLALVAAESDDVVLIDQVAAADLGDLDDQAVGTAITQARAVTNALTATAWEVLEALRDRAATDLSAQDELDRLRYAAGHDQHAADLAAALPAAVRAAAGLLAATSPAPAVTVPPPSTPVTAAPPAAAATAAPATAAPAVGPVTTRTVTDPTGWDRVAAEIRRQLESGHQVTVTWEVT
jgi:hypothetical protein